jgi:hypothetical protein
MRPEDALQPGRPALWTLDASSERALAWAVEMREEESGTWALRWLRGSRMKTLEGLHDEAAAALQFPPYYGATLDAMHDALTDLEWLEADGFLFLILEGEHALSEAPEAWESFSEVLGLAAETWDEMDGAPFNVVLVAEGTGLEVLRARLALTGVRAEALELPAVN